MVLWRDGGCEQRTDGDRGRDKRQKERGRVILSGTVLLSSGQEMTLSVPYQSIIIISYARVVLPASVCLG